MSRAPGDGEFPPTPFLSPRNVPLWMGVLLVLAVIGLVLWVPR
ncbi:hypothetical protein [Phenylobacterium sp.]|nr:hypothetical protein [Phenylobacterium sp.]